MLACFYLACPDSIFTTRTTTAATTASTNAAAGAAAAAAAATATAASLLQHCYWLATARAGLLLPCLP